MNKKEQKSIWSAKANVIVKMLEKFTQEELLKEVKGLDKFPEMSKNLQEIFLTGAWYGSYKTLEMEEKEARRNHNGD